MSNSLSITLLPIAQDALNPKELFELMERIGLSRGSHYHQLEQLKYSYLAQYSSRNNECARTDDEIWQRLIPDQLEIRYSNDGSGEANTSLNIGVTTVLPNEAKKEIGPFAQVATEGSRQTISLRDLLAANNETLASLAAACCRSFGARTFCTNMPAETLTEMLDGPPKSSLEHTPACFGGLHPEATNYLLSLGLNHPEFETVPLETSIGEIYLQRRI